MSRRTFLSACFPLNMWALSQWCNANISELLHKSSHNYKSYEEKILQRVKLFLEWSGFYVVTYSVTGGVVLPRIRVDSCHSSNENKQSVEINTFFAFYTSSFSTVWSSSSMCELAMRVFSWRFHKKWTTITVTSVFFHSDTTKCSNWSGDLKIFRVIYPLISGPELEATNAKRIFICTKTFRTLGPKIFWNTPSRLQIFWQRPAPKISELLNFSINNYPLKKALYPTIFKQKKRNFLPFLSE